MGWRCQSISQMQMLFCTDSELLTNHIMTDREREGGGEKKGRKLVGEIGREEEPSNQESNV